MKISARNILEGTVKTIHKGAVNSEVVITLPCGQEIVSIITNASAKGLGIRKGRTAYAVIKASSVMVGVD
jgi:molybdate transport system regulatory protein